MATDVIFYASYRILTGKRNSYVFLHMEHGDTDTDERISNGGNQALVPLYDPCGL